MKILAIDPGPVESAYVLYVSGSRVLKHYGKIANSELIPLVMDPWWAGQLAIEIPACYGMAVGKSLFDTCIVAGQIIQAWGRSRPYNRVLRKGRWGPASDTTGAEGEFPGVAITLCRVNTANDSNIRQAIIDAFPATGGGAVPQIGTKKQPGPLYGVSKDIWSALAVALTWAEHMDGADTIAEQE